MSPKICEPLEFEVWNALEGLVMSGYGDLEPSYFHIRVKRLYKFVPWIVCNKL